MLCHFSTPSIERIYNFEILMLRDSIDVDFKSSFSIFLTKPNVPTKIVNVPTDQAELKSGGSCLHLLESVQYESAKVVTGAMRGTGRERL